MANMAFHRLPLLQAAGLQRSRRAEGHEAVRLSREWLSPSGFSSGPKRPALAMFHRSVGPVRMATYNALHSVATRNGRASDVYSYRSMADFI